MCDKSQAAFARKVIAQALVIKAFASAVSFRVLAALALLAQAACWLPGLQQDLAVLNARLLADRLAEAAIGKGGTELCMDVAQAFRAYVKENPGLYMATLRASGTQPDPDPDLIREEEGALKVGLAVVTSLGLKGDDAIHAVRAFRSMVHGFATLEVAGGFGLPQDCDKSFRRLVEALALGLRNKK